jgi:SAM-dependent methyltransferase
MRSAERAQSLGEVFTQPRDVNAILDLIADQNYASRYLEPGCGSGNFLVEILNRKLDLVDGVAKPSHQAGPESVAEWEFLALSALASIYGIDIEEINVAEARERLSLIFLNSRGRWNKICPTGEDFRASASWVLDHNIVLGDMLEGQAKIKLVEYAELSPRRFKRRVFQYDDLLYPEEEVFDNANVMFPHIPQAIQELPVADYNALGAAHVD